VKRSLFVLAIAVVALSGQTVALARDRPTEVTCYKSSSGLYKTQVRPKSCAFVVRGKDPLGVNTVETTNLQWRNWGARTATASGFRFSQERRRVRVILSGKSQCDDMFLYTRARFVQDGRTLFSIPLGICPR